MIKLQNPRSFMNFHSNFNDEDDVNTKSVLEVMEEVVKCLFIQSTEKYSSLFVCRENTQFYSKPTFFFFFLMTNDVKAKICQKLEWFYISSLYLDCAPCAVV